MFDKIAVIGDADLVYPLRALGFRVFTPTDAEEAREILLSLEREQIALCFLHERYFESLAKERQQLERKLCPVIAGFSDFRQVTDYLEHRLREMAVKATGSDALVNGRNG
jgi:vacuolar-type H+-ATPase subunit F/Vma7